MMEGLDASDALGSSTKRGLAISAPEKPGSPGMRGTKKRPKHSGTSQGGKTPPGIEGTGQGGRGRKAQGKRVAEVGFKANQFLS